MKLYLFYLINLSMFSLIAMDNPYPLHSAAAKGDACWFDPADKQANNEINNDVVDKLNKALTGGVCGLVIALKKHDHQGYCDPKFKKTDNK